MKTRINIDSPTMKELRNYGVEFLPYENYSDRNTYIPIRVGQRLFVAVNCKETELKGLIYIARLAAEVQYAK